MAHPEPASQARGDQGQLDFLAAMKNDFKIICGDATYNVHRFVIGLHSPYFKRICDGGFAESVDGSVTLREDPPFAVKLMVDYFYTFEYDFLGFDAWELGSAVEGRTASPLEVHCWLVTIADKYDIPNLKKKALESANRWLRVFSCSVARQMVGLATALYALETATAYVYSNASPNDRRLKDAVVKTWIEDDHVLIKSASRESFDKLLADIPEFAAELVATMSGRGLESGGGDAIVEEEGVQKED